MRRRQLLRRTGTTTAGVAGLAGAASADEPTHVSWEFEDGTTELIPMSEFDRRSDTPALADVQQEDDDLGGCCCCPDSVVCTPCFFCECY